MRVTIVICTHQRAALLRRALLSIVEQARESGADILVVDNASSDDKPGPIGKTPADRKSGGQQNQATIEEFDREGLGVAPKE